MVIISVYSNLFQSSEMFFLLALPGESLFLASRFSSDSFLLGAIDELNFSIRFVACRLRSRCVHSRSFIVSAAISLSPRMIEEVFLYME